MTARPFVDLDIPPHTGELDCWGRDAHGHWWGLVTWVEEVVEPQRFGRRTGLPCSGWAAAGHLRPRADERYSNVPRIDLPADKALWPPATDRGSRYWWPANAHHVGTLSGASIDLPEGYMSRERA